MISKKKKLCVKCYVVNRCLEVNCLSHCTCIIFMATANVCASIVLVATYNSMSEFIAVLNTRMQQEVFRYIVCLTCMFL